MAPDNHQNVPLVELPAKSAGGPFGRLRGLLGRPPPPAGQALWIAPCRQVHTLGMRYPIDVVHLDREGRVLLVETLEPWRVGRFVWRAGGVLELVAGEAKRLGMTAGATVRLIEVGPHATSKRQPKR
jgi:uncharacterized membrane protein (UPF0127 family)